MPTIVTSTGQQVYATREIAARVRQARAAREGRAPAVPPGPAKPAPTARRADWDAYAEAIGLDPSAFKSKTSLIAAIQTGHGEAISSSPALSPGDGGASGRGRG